MAQFLSSLLLIELKSAVWDPKEILNGFLDAIN